MTEVTPEHGVPEFKDVTIGILRQALALGWKDMKETPGFGLLFAGFYVVCGILMYLITRATGQTYWLILAVFGFPLFSPFAAVGFYEVSRRLERGLAMDWMQIFSVVWRQSKRQLPSISAVIVVILMFWFFLGHMIFALFLGLSPMTNVSSSFEVYLSSNGLSMLAFGTLVGAAFSLILYMITVISLPLLLDREVDFVTAMISSFQLVQDNWVPMLLWGALIALCSLVAMIPMFFGLFLILPLFGHASWHLYALLKDE